MTALDRLARPAAPDEPGRALGTHLGSQPRAAHPLRAVGPTTPSWLRRLRLIGVLLPVAAIITLQLARPSIADVAGEHRADLVTGILSTVAAVLFGVAMFALIGRGHRVIARQHRELVEVNGLLTEIARQQPLTTVLRRTQQLVHDQLEADDCGVVVPGATELPPGGPLLRAPVAGPPGTAPGLVWARRERSASSEEQRLLQSAADLVSLSLAQNAALERERHVARADELDRIAREMHDSLAQVLGTLHLRLRVLQSAADLPAPAAAEVDDLGDLCHAAYQDVREAIVGLRSVNRQDEPFLDAVRRFVAHYGRHGGPPTTVDSEVPDLQLPDEVQMHLLRIVQEALTNVRKHAVAGGAQVRIRRREGLLVEIEDDGQGFAPDAEEGSRPTRQGFGLETMRERAAIVGGAVTIVSRPGGGTTVRVHLPEHALTADLQRPGGGHDRT